MLKQLRKTITNLISPVKNSVSIGNEFFRFGNSDQNRLLGDWSSIVMSDRDLYNGYAYAVIRNRANGVARLVDDHLRTESNVPDLDHPYLELIWESRDFSDFKFWHDISTYLDLEGVYYLGVVRAVSGNRYGSIQKFVLLNPYNIRRILNPDTLAVEGYVESRNGMVREWSKDMIIEMRELNPFDEENPYSMTDAAKESQFILKTASDHTKNSLKNNINAPGILGTDVVLEPEKFKNFIARVRQHVKGEPIFTNGSGAVKWQDMQIDMSKAAVKDINEVTRETLFSVGGMSKTMMGIEQSGTTRDTAKVQKDLSIEGHIIPRIRLIIDALNLDYRVHYQVDYQRTGATIMIDNPTATDHDSDIKKAEAETKDFELYQKMRAEGYSAKIASEYVKGTIGIDELGEPTEKPKVIEADETDSEETKNSLAKKKDKNNHIVNKLSLDEEQEIQRQESILKNSIVNVEEVLVVTAINRLSKKKNNDYEQESDLVTKTEKRESVVDLTLVLAGFYTVLFKIIGQQQADDRAIQFGLPSFFVLDKAIKSYIKDTSKKVAESHIDTILDDLLTTAREAAKEGLSQQEIISRLKNKYTADISTNRAKTVARTETNRVFTRAQFEADKQFVEENELTDRAYKRWRTRSDNPCEFCKSLEAEGEIPFDKDFRKLGSSVNVDVDGKTKKLKVSFEALEAGNAHPNCSCIYELIIRKE